MKPVKKFITAHKEAQSNGVIIEVIVNGKSFYIPVQDFDQNEGFEVKQWNVSNDGAQLAGSATNKDICRLYRESLPKPFCHKVSP